MQLLVGEREALEVRNAEQQAQMAQLRAEVSQLRDTLALATVERATVLGASWCDSLCVTKFFERSSERLRELDRVADREASDVKRCGL